MKTKRMGLLLACGLILLSSFMGACDNELSHMSGPLIHGGRELLHMSVFLIHPI